jgi:hypothetical protein
LPRILSLVCLGLVAVLPLAAQKTVDQVAAQGFGPVAVSGGQRLDVCVGNLGEGNSRSTVQVMSLAGDNLHVVTKFDPSLASGKSACYKYAPKSGSEVLSVILAGDPKAGWDISDRNLVVSVQVVDASSGKLIANLAPLPKVVSTKLLQK